MPPPARSVSLDEKRKPDWLGYYRDSAADAAAFTFDIASLKEGVLVSFGDLMTGRLPKEIATELFGVSKGAKKGRSKNKTTAGTVPADEEPVNLLVLPWIYNLRRYHGHLVNDWRRAFVPVFLFAQMDAEGTLSPLENGRPLIPRDRLLPVEHNGPVIGNLAAADDFASANDFAPAGWADCLEYAARLVTAVSESAPDKLDRDGYQLMDCACVMSLDAARIKNPSAALLRLYDLLQNTDKAQSVDFSSTALSGLLGQAGKSADARVQPLAHEGLCAFAISARRFATTSAQYPLARSQRLAVQQLITLKHGEVLAIQGPPGTGKTTLLKSLVAQLWVDAAKNEAPCPIITACSTNNQAVTNIIDAFGGDGDSNANLWRRRWLPDIRSLGIYAASSRQGAGEQQELERKYQILKWDKTDLAGFFPEMEKSPAWFERALPSYISNAREAFADAGLVMPAASADSESSSNILRNIRSRLLVKLHETTERSQNIITNLHAILTALEKSPAPISRDTSGIVRPLESSGVAGVETAMTRLARLKKEAEIAAYQVSEISALCERITQCSADWDIHLSNEPWWQTLFAWLPAVRHRRDAGRRVALKRFADLCDWPKELVSRPDAVAAQFETLLNVTSFKKTAAQKVDDSAKQALSHWNRLLGNHNAHVSRLCQDARKHGDEIARKLANSLEKHADDCSDGMDETSASAIDELLDVTWREEAFCLATHYWEAGYLLELQELLKQENVPNLRYSDERERAFRRWAKIAPITVSTFFMLPRFYTAIANGEPKPMCGVIDLLLADEAGQVSPEKAVPSFALARRAIVVGDTRQIEPVWNVPECVDAANARHHHLLPDSASDSIREWRIERRASISASAGSLMALAEQASPVSQIPQLGGGLFLSEHRRCVPELIHYCNKYVYQGRLAACRESIEPDARILPPFGYAHIPSFFKATKRAGWSNSGEARTLVAWLKAKRAELETHYSKNGEPTHISKVVAIITPFRAQKNLILEELKLQFGKEHDITVGTVHALQGAERPVVIFSATYDHTYTGKCFFDQSPNMLNVAVSRAKDTFLVFGCLDHFNPKRDTPAGWLGRELFGPNGAEITDIPWKDSGEVPLESEYVHGTPAHEKILVEALTNATQRVIISSPFLTMPGLLARNILEQLSRRRGEISVEVFTDYGFVHESEQRLQTYSEAKKIWEEHGAVVRVSRPEHAIHGKTLIMDDNVLVEGSFNWLSAAKEGTRYSRHETSIVCRGGNVSKMIEIAFDALTERCPNENSGLE